MQWQGKKVDFDCTRITGGFWKERQHTFRTATLPAIYDRFEETGRFEALKQNWKPGMPFQPHIFWESDVTKWIEGAAYFLAQQRDEALEAQIDDLVERMANGQQEDGYLNEYFTVVEPEKRFTLRSHHELYCAGHLIEGAIAYANATGKTRLLDVALRYVKLIDRVFRIEHSAAFDTPGHEEIELALIKLYRHTGDKTCLELCRYFLETRGNSPREAGIDAFGDRNSQSHLPVRQQRTADGHAVRALYLYCGMADLAQETQDDELFQVCHQLFENITQKRMYVTGAIGSTRIGEAFSFDYDLPEYTAYSETCAAIALALFCRRMAAMTADSAYADTAELAMYNAILSGISLTGDSFFYENPLAVDPRAQAFNATHPRSLQASMPILQRVRVFGCSCCPPNILRFVASIADFMYTTSGTTLFAQCYMAGDTDLVLNGHALHLRQETRYPHDGHIWLQITPEEVACDFTLALRIPNWCHRFTLKINGTPVDAQPQQGFLYLERCWASGDTVDLDLAMDVQLLRSHPQNLHACGRLAVRRGPLIFCAEGIDHEDTPLRDIRIDRTCTWTLREEEVAGVLLPTLTTTATITQPDAALYSDLPPTREPITLKLIPYAAWANRGVTEMNTWFLEG